MVRRSGKDKWIIICLLFTFFIVACTHQEVGSGNRIIIKASGSIITLPHINSLSVDGTGEISVRLPKGLGDNPEWSPDGQWVVYDTQYNIGGLYKSQIYIMRSDGSHRVKVTNNSWGSFHPVWSPDGSHIGYEESGKIYLLDVKCILIGEKCNFTPIFLTSGESPDWSPDGKFILYVNIEMSNEIVRSKVLIINIDGTKAPQNLTPVNSTYCHQARWSPDGSRIVVGCDGNIYIMDSNGFNVKKIGEGGSPLWSPDGSQIAFISERDDDLGKPLDFEGSTTSNALYKMNIDGTNIIRLSLRNNENVLWYAWMP